MPEVGFGIIGCGTIAPLHANSIREIEGALGEMIVAGEVGS